MKKNIALLFIIIALCGILYGAVGTFSMIGGGQAFAGFGISELYEIPIFARIECSKDANPKVDYEAVGSTESWRTFVCDGNVQENEGCEIEVTAMGGSWQDSGVLNLDYQICDINGANCGNLQETDIQKAGDECRNENELISSPSCKWQFIFQLKTGQSIQFEDLENWLQQNRPYGVRTTRYYWSLYDYCGGAKEVVTSESCKLPTSGLKNMLASDNPLTNFNFGEWRNYVCNWAYGPATNVYKHPDYGTVYCMFPKVYAINTIKLADGSTKNLDPNVNQNLQTSSGQQITIKGIGKELGTVDCCPNQPQCDAKTFKFKKEEVTKSCNSDIQCSNRGAPIAWTLNSYKEEKCVDGFCKLSDEITVECTSAANCPVGKDCDLSLSNYGKCVDSITPNYCGNGICDKQTENSQNCPSDCGIKLQNDMDYLPVIVLVIALLVLFLSFVAFKVLKNK